MGTLMLEIRDRTQPSPNHIFVGKSRAALQALVAELKSSAGIIS